MMQVALINERVLFQRNSVRVDAVGNHLNTWEDYFSCFATIGGEGFSSSRETENAGQVVEDVSMTVTVRYCEKIADVRSVFFRIIFHGEIYDITNVDHLNFKKKCVKFVCKKVRR